jgi:hypothetical protein
MKAFKEVIEDIGQNMTTCELACDGIYSNPAKGILPRCLFVEERGNQGLMHITIAIGMNPGIANEDEMERLKGVTCYSTACEKLARYADNDYYKRCTWLIDDLKLDGDILWTEVVKCQNEVPRRNPNVYTSAFCAGRYLFQEVKAAKERYDKVTILTIGKEVYNQMIFMFPEDKIVGVYHPRSYGFFDRMFNTSDSRRWKLKYNFKESMQAMLASDNVKHGLFRAAIE